jgi:predicted  nucleic acid-binding Zn-ribbon protein
MNLQERLQQLAQQREQLFVALHEVNGAMKILEEQILETQTTSEANQPSNKEALEQLEETASST